MGLEIERKFLVIGNDYKKEAYKKQYIIQGYICSDPEKIVRIRIKDNNAYLTIKSNIKDSNFSRLEFEYNIPLKDANEILSLCQSSVIKKYRYLVKVENHTFEIDEFLEKNNGLVIAELELKTENEIFSKPLWIGQEVTFDKKYNNVNLVNNPYNKW